MPRKVSENTNVAYFDEAFVEAGLIEKPGFYIVEKEAHENTVVPHGPDGKEIPGAAEVSLGPKLGKQVFPDTRPITTDEDGNPVNEREAGWFHTPFSEDDGGEE